MMTQERYDNEAAELTGREDMQQMLHEAHDIIEKVRNMKDDDDYPEFSKVAYHDNVIGSGSFELGVFAGIYFSKNK